jgi:hypothetical protein
VLVCAAVAVAWLPAAPGWWPGGARVFYPEHSWHGRRQQAAESRGVSHVQSYDCTDKIPKIIVIGVTNNNTQTIIIGVYRLSQCKYNISYE